MSRIVTYFDKEELFCPHTVKVFGDKAWQLLDDRLVDTLLVIREKLGRPMYVNSWAIGGPYSQRGYRCNICPIVREKTSLEKVYASAHLMGKAVDFDVKGMAAEEVRQWLKRNQILLPYPIRLERNVNWVHLDTRCPIDADKITFFNG